VLKRRHLSIHCGCARFFKEEWMDRNRNTWNFKTWFAGAFVVACSIALFAPRMALAHAVLIESQPGVNSSVSGPEVAVLLKYSSRIDLEHSTLTLLDPDGKVEKVVIESEPTPGVLTAKLTGLVKGAYVLRWQVLATDGHVTRGKVPFQVK
jgi:methionine-rich copper-binding protein CopC